MTQNNSEESPTKWPVQGHDPCLLTVVFIMRNWLSFYEGDILPMLLLFDWPMVAVAVGPSSGTRVHCCPADNLKLAYQ
jgi:hypothetical protein